MSIELIPGYVKRQYPGPHFVSDFAAVADKFKKLYQYFNPEKPQAENDINNGDCGVFALAVGYVLSKKHPYPVQYHDNLNHGYISMGIGDDRFDSANYEGIPSAEMKERWNSDSELTLDFQGMCDAFIPYDVKGAFMIDTLCKMEGVPTPEQVQILVDNIAGHELSEWCDRYRGYQTAALNA